MIALPYKSSFMGRFSFLTGLLDYTEFDKSMTYYGEYPLELAEGAVIPGAHGANLAYGRQFSMPKTMPFRVVFEDGHPIIIQAGFFNLFGKATSFENLIPAVYLIRETAVEVRLGTMGDGFYPSHETAVEYYAPFFDARDENRIIFWTMTSHRLCLSSGRDPVVMPGFRRLPNEYVPLHLTSFFRSFCNLVARRAHMKTRIEKTRDRCLTAFTIAPSDILNVPALYVTTSLRRGGRSSYVLPPQEAYDLYIRATKYAQGQSYSDKDVGYHLAGMINVLKPAIAEAWDLGNEVYEGPDLPVKTEVERGHYTAEQRIAATADAADVYREARQSPALKSGESLKVWAMLSQNLMDFVIDIYLHCKEHGSVKDYKDFTRLWWHGHEVTADHYLVADILGKACAKF